MTIDSAVRQPSALVSLGYAFPTPRWYEKLWFILTASISGGVLLLCLCAGAGWKFKQAQDAKAEEEAAEGRLQEQAEKMVRALGGQGKHPGSRGPCELHLRMGGPTPLGLTRLGRRHRRKPQRMRRRRRTRRGKMGAAR